MWVGSLDRSSSSLLPFKTIWRQGGNLFSLQLVRPHTFFKEMFTSFIGKQNSPQKKIRKIVSIFSAFPLYDSPRERYLWPLFKHASDFHFGLCFSLTTSSCYCEMWLPEVAFPRSFQDNPWARVSAREEGRKTVTGSFP